MRPRWRSERPEAIDGASLATAASAEDGDPAGFLPREEWRRSRQGKKLDGRHCAIGDRGAAGLRPDQLIEEAVWSGPPTGIVQGGNGNSECPRSCLAKEWKSSLALQASPLHVPRYHLMRIQATLQPALAALFGAYYSMPSGCAGFQPKPSIRPAPPIRITQPSIRPRRTISASVPASPTRAFRCRRGSARQVPAWPWRSRARTP